MAGPQRTSGQRGNSDKGSKGNRKRARALSLKPVKEEAQKAVQGGGS